jgi:hypothetical protein
MDFPPEHFRDLTNEYLSERKKVVGYTLYQPGEPGGHESAPKLEVHWVYSPLTNGTH